MPIEIFALGSGSLALVAIVLMVVSRVTAGTPESKTVRHRDHWNPGEAKLAALARFHRFR